MPTRSGIEIGLPVDAHDERKVENSVSREEEEAINDDEAAGERNIHRACVKR